MRRREFITFIGSAVAWPLAARAQQVAMPVIGILGLASAAGYAHALAAFRLGLRDEGFVEGGNVAIEYRWAEDRLERLPALAAELVRRNVAVVFTAGGTATALAAKAASTTVPIVFALGGDPAKAGLVASLNRPGGNVTGIAQFSELLITKRLELVHELVPRSSRIALLVNPDNPNAKQRAADMLSAARAMGLDLRVANAASAAEFEGVFAALTRERIDALVVQNETVFTNQRDRLVAIAAKYAVPAIYEYREFIEAGGLISYGASFAASYRQAGVYAGRILKGAKPADLPVIRPTKFELVINLKAAKALGLNIPESFLLRADKVIE